MAKKKKSSQSPFFALASIFGISLVTAVIADKVFAKPSNNNDKNIDNQRYQGNQGPRSHHAEVVGNPITQQRPPVQQQQQHQQPSQTNEVQTIPSNTPIMNQGPRISGYPIQVDQQSQQQMNQQYNNNNMMPAPMVVPPRQKQPPVTGNGYRGLISSQALENIRDSNKPIVASSKIMTTNQQQQRNDNNDDSGDYPYPTEILTPEAMAINQQE